MFRLVIIGSAIIFSTLLIGCGGPANTNAPVTNANTTANNSAVANDPFATTKTRTEEATTNAAPTVGPVYKAYCDAWLKSDEAALKKVFSSDTLKPFESEMKMDNEKSLMKWLDDERISGPQCDVANEVITGDTATAMVKTNKTPNGVKRVFVKEAGEWKLTNKVPDIDSVKKAAPGQAPK